jgi:hypothetical protein
LSSAAEEGLDHTRFPLPALPDRQAETDHSQSLPENLNASAGLANGDILVVRVDDICPPHHISRHIRAM